MTVWESEAPWTHMWGVLSTSCTRVLLTSSSLDRYNKGAKKMDATPDTPLLNMGDVSAVVRILDIRNYHNGADKHQHDVADIIVRGLKAPFNAKSLPTVLLYNQRGLRLYDSITTDAPEYYLFGAEVEILHRHASEIVRIMQSHALATSQGIPAQVLLELGSG